MANHILLRKINLTQSAASVTFANIPQSGYTDLKVVGSARVTSAGETNPPMQRLEMLINGVNTGAKYSIKLLYGIGSSAGSVGGASANRNFYDGAATASGATANTFSNFEVYLPNYTASANKSFSINSVTENNGTGADASFTAGLFADTTSISSLVFQPYDGSSFVQYSTFSLYGVAATGTSADSGPKASGGNTISSDGTYWYHTFLTSGFFTPIQTLSSNYYVLGGGATGSGGGSSGSGGGGGGGGSSYVTSSNLTAQPYAVTIGAGGPTGGSAATAGSVGNNSTFNSTTGGGGQQQASFSVASPGGTGTTQNGGAGGRGFNSGNAENGGAGYTNPLDSVTRGGGGGGSTKSGTQGTGTNGGGNGSSSGTGGNATVNTGGGGGGSAEDNVGYGGAGGSGIVIIRYAV